MTAHKVKQINKPPKQEERLIISGGFLNAIQVALNAQPDKKQIEKK